MKQVKRTEKENDRYITFIKSAIDEAEQSINCITYSFFPEVNAELRKKIQTACCLLEEAIESEIYKPVKS